MHCLTGAECPPPRPGAQPLARARTGPRADVHADRGGQPADGEMDGTECGLGHSGTRAKPRLCTSLLPLCTHFAPVVHFAVHFARHFARDLGGKVTLPPAAMR